MKKKLLIVTLNDYIIYQPTILNLYDFLKPHFDVKIISFEPSYISKTKDEKRNIHYLQTNRSWGYILKKLDFVFSRCMAAASKINKKFRYEHRYYTKYLPSVLKKWLLTKEQDADIVIAVDFPALQVAQQVYGEVNFLSLEIENEESSYYRMIDPGKIKSVFIQSPERLQYLLPGKLVKSFIVQNAPVFDGETGNHSGRKDFIFAGTALRVFGIFECLDFLDRYPGFRMVQKGGIEMKVKKRIKRNFSHLVQSGRLELDNSYLPSKQFISFLSGFRIGFCFYSWKLIEQQFNYRTAPSGKLFMYMAAGVPVIACDIPGFQVVRDYQAGVLIKDYLPETISKAVEEIEADYETFSANCYKVARGHSFDKSVKPYIEFLLQQKKY